MNRVMFVIVMAIVVALYQTGASLAGGMLMALRSSSLYLFLCIYVVLIWSLIHHTGLTTVTPLPFGIAMLVLMLGFLLVPVKTGPLIFFRSQLTEEEEKVVTDGMALLVNDDLMEASGDDLLKRSLRDSSVNKLNSDLEDLSLLQVFQRLDFYILFVSYFLCTGPGITNANNLAEMVFANVKVEPGVTVRLLSLSLPVLFFTSSLLSFTSSLLFSSSAFSYDS